MPKLKWLGRCPKIVPRPIPLRFLHEKTGEVVFNHTAEVTEEEAEYLLSLGGMFKRVGLEARYPPKPSPVFDPRKFETQAVARNYIKKNDLHARTKKLGSSWRVELLTPKEEAHATS